MEIQKDGDSIFLKLPKDKKLSCIYAYENVLQLKLKEKLKGKANLLIRKKRLKNGTDQS